MASSVQTDDYRRIIVLGETGVGKSSLINLVTGENRATTSDAAVGCTFEVSKYTDRVNKNIFYDTVGLNEPKKGTICAKEAMRSLTILLKTIESGVNLIIFVIRKGRITEAMATNYAVFVHGICGNKVPVILAVTGCECDADPDRWYYDNQEHFEKNGMVFNEVVCGCFTNQVDKLKPAMQQVILESMKETKEKMTRVLTNTDYSEAYKFESWFNWLKKIVGPVWNAVAVHYKWPQISIWDTLRDVLMEILGLDATEATEMSNEYAKTLG